MTRGKTSRLRRLAWCLLALLLGVPAVAGHVFYWYLPRSRPAVPQVDSAAVRLSTNSEFSVALWVPFPHQNLSVLGELASRDPRYLEAMLRLAGLPAVPLPTFGPFAVPPARDMAVVSDRSGEHFALVARIYPLMAMLAKLGGRLAANPWLAGGEVDLEGRVARVEWRGAEWWVTSDGIPAPGAPPAIDSAAWAWIEMRQPAPPLPPGSYLLRGSAAAGFELATVAPAAPASRLQGSELGQDEVFLVALAGRDNHLHEPVGALLFFELAEDSRDLPRAAVLYQRGAERWQLPGESILELGGRQPHHGEAAGWQVDAIDRVALAGGRRLAATLMPLTERAGLAWGLWLDLARGGDEVRRIADMMRQNPLVPPRATSRWQDAGLLLEPLGQGFSTFIVEVRATPPTARLALLPADPEVSTRPADD